MSSQTPAPLYLTLRKERSVHRSTAVQKGREHLSKVTVCSAVRRRTFVRRGSRNVRFEAWRCKPRYWVFIALVIYDEIV